MNSAQELRDRASRYRDMTYGINDPQAIEALRELADRYDAFAAEIEAKEQAARCSSAIP
jgi:hypothetical protein